MSRILDVKMKQNRFTIELQNILEVIQEDTKWTHNPEKIEDLYHLLRRIQNVSALENDLDVFRGALSLLNEIERKEELFTAKIDGNRLLSMIENLSATMEQKTPERVHSSSAVNLGLKAAVFTSSEALFEWAESGFQEAGMKSYVGPPSVDFLFNEDISFLFVDVRERYALDIIRRVKTFEHTNHIQTVLSGPPLNEKEWLTFLEAGIDFYIPPNSSLPHLLSVWLNSRVRTKGQRETFKLFLKKEWEHFQRDQSPFSLVMVAFHGEGKERARWRESAPLLLRTYQSMVRSYDEVSMWDQDSILFLLPSTNLSNSMEVAARIQYHSSLLSLDTLLTITSIQSEGVYSSPEDMVKRLREEVSFYQRTMGSVPLHAPNFTKRTGNSRLKLLCVDADPVSPTIVQNHLDPEEWEVRICLDGTDALEQTLQWRPDAILCETNTPFFDGFLFTSQIRQVPHLRNITIVFLSTSGLNKHVIRGFKAGCDDYIVKPFSAVEVETRISRLLNIRKLVQE